MWTSLLKLFTPAKSALVPYVLCVLCLLFIAWQHSVHTLRLSAARAELNAEQAAHDVTRSAIDQALADIARLQATLDAAHNSTSALQDSLRDALAREADAVTAAAARKQILDQMRTRTRTEPETLEVIDDDTRRAVTDRLNRPL